VEGPYHSRKNSDCKDVCDTIVHVPSEFNLCAKDTVIEVNKLLFQFIWKGKDKVKRISLVGDIDKGGLKAPHVESIIKCQRIMCNVKVIGRLFFSIT